MSFYTIQYPEVHFLGTQANRQYCRIKDVANLNNLLCKLRETGTTNRQIGCGRNQFVLSTQAAKMICAKWMCELVALTRCFLHLLIITFNTHML